MSRIRYGRKMREGAKQNIGISFSVTVHVDTVVPVTTMADDGWNRKSGDWGGGFFCGLSDWVVFKESNGDSSHLVWDTKGSGERRRRKWRSPVSKVGQLKQPLYQKTFLCLITFLIFPARSAFLFYTVWSIWPKFGWWMHAGHTVKRKSPSCCAASLASSPGH